tara:strand:+ start:285 stop:458 length:174 start_codon:yes stop_codon:yes gene_type:complete
VELAVVELVVVTQVLILQVVILHPQFQVQLIQVVEEEDLQVVMEMGVQVEQVVQVLL